jgi:hypothetical protein
MNKKLAAATIVAGLGIGGFAGTILGNPSVSSAQTAGSTVAPAATGTAAADPAARPKPFADAIAGLVTDGTLTQAQADKVTAALVAARPAGDHGGREGRGGPGGAGRGAQLTVVAATLGITEADVQTALQGGQTIAQVAASKNVDVQKVVDAIVADFKTKEQAEVATGDHTQAEVDAKVAEFTTHVTDMVNGKMPAGGKGGPGMGGRGPRGDKPAAAPAASAPAA